MVVSSGVPPQEIIDRTTHEWARANGTRLQIKDLQYVDSETVVTIFVLGRLADLKEAREVLSTCWVEATSIASFS